MKIVMSSGHGKHIRGAAGPSPWGLDEVNEARKVVEQTATELRKLGVDVITWHDDQSTSQSENLNRITNYHNSQIRDYDVSVHFNAYQVTTSKPMGIEVLYVTQEKLAKKVCDAMVAATGLPNRGPKYRGDLAFLNNTSKPSVLVETLFCDAKIDCDTYRAKFTQLCQAIAEGLSGQQAQPGPEPEPPTPEPAPEPGTLEGKQLRYLIGGDDTASGANNEVVELSYDAIRPPAHGIGVKYGNLFNEKYAEQSAVQRARYAPYLEQGDTAEEYNEGQIDPSGQGWHKNLDEQIQRAKQQGFKIIEWDNPDSYSMEDVLDAVEFAHNEGLQVLAKNPGICAGSKVAYVKHPAVVGIVVEEGCGAPGLMETIRVEAGKPTLPVWFVAFGNGKDWADNAAETIRASGYTNMGVTYSTQGEYRNSTDVLVPNATPGPVPPQPSEEHATVGKGDTGPDVVTLQKALGVLKADGDFGSITDTWVKAFQSACALTSDGIVGPMTWGEVDALQARVDNADLHLPKELADQIYTMAQTSEIAEYSWPDRGVPPPGYIAAMALCFATAFTRAENNDAAAKAMSKELGPSDKDALAWYKAELTAQGLTFAAWDDRLRALFTLMIGLGPRESSGKYCEGRDLSASNVASDTAEAGLFQTSWNIRSAHSSIAPLLPEFWDEPTGFLGVFKDGISPTANNLNSYGSGDGIKYQFLSRFAPLFHVLITGVGLRTLRQHWGPINRKEVTIKREAHALLQSIQELIEAQA